MSQQRRNIFENLPSIDDKMSQFTPKQGPANAPPPEKVAEVAEKMNFTSREPGPQIVAGAVSPPIAAASTTRPRREPMYHRTGRTAQFTCKTTPEIIDAFYDFAARKGWKVGETFEHAFEALLEKDVTGNC